MASGCTNQSAATVPCVVLKRTERCEREASERAIESRAEWPSREAEQSECNAKLNAMLLLRIVKGQRRIFALL